MWLRRAKPVSREMTSSEVQMSASDRFDLRLKVLVKAREHYHFFLP